MRTFCPLHEIEPLFGANGSALPCVLKLLYSKGGTMTPGCPCKFEMEFVMPKQSKQKPVSFETNSQTGSVFDDSMRRLMKVPPPPNGKKAKRKSAKRKRGKAR